MDQDEMDKSSDAAIDYARGYVQTRFDDYADLDNEEMVRNYTNQAVIDVVQVATPETFRYCAYVRNWAMFDEDQYEQLEGLSGRVRRNVELEQQLSIYLQERNRARVEEERARARDRTVMDMKNDIDEYFDLGDEDVEKRMRLYRNLGEVL